MGGSSWDHSEPGRLDAERLPVSAERMQELVNFAKGVLLATATTSLEGRRHGEKQRPHDQALASLAEVGDAYLTLLDAVAHHTRSDTVSSRRILAWAMQRMGSALRDIGIIVPELPSEVVARSTSAPAQNQPSSSGEAQTSAVAPVETPGQSVQPVSSPTKLSVCSQCKDVLLTAPDPTAPPGTRDVVRMYCSCSKARDVDGTDFVDHQTAFQEASNPRLRFKALDGGRMSTGKPRGKLFRV